MRISRVLASFFLCLSFLIISYNEVYAQPNKTDVATFAGGCFWCTQSDFDKLKGVVKTTAGYTGGDLINPNYHQVSNGGTGHYESVQIIYDPLIVSYQQLLNYFWHNIDPTNANGQFCDKGAQYQAVIFYHNEDQKRLAIESKEQLIKQGYFNKVVTQILPAKTFYPAEDYHQKYYQKNPVRYHFYRYTCGRDQRLQELWGKP